MRWHCLQHVSFEGPAYLALWARTRDFPLTQTHLWKGEPLPTLDEFDGLCVLGGPMNVYEEDRYPWLAAEKLFIEKAIRAGKPVLGICLGAQLLAVVLGGEVSRNRQREIGWFPVELTEEGRRAVLLEDFPDQFWAFHWHGDRFTLPTGSTHLAASRLCQTQAFLFNGHVLGLQFHLESTRESITALIEYCGDEIGPGASTQSPEKIEKGNKRLPQTHRILDILLDRFCKICCL